MNRTEQVPHDRRINRVRVSLNLHNHLASNDGAIVVSDAVDPSVAAHASVLGAETHPSHQFSHELFEGGWVHLQQRSSADINTKVPCRLRSNPRQHRRVLARPGSQAPIERTYAGNRVNPQQIDAGELTPRNSNTDNAHHIEMSGRGILQHCQAVDSQFLEHVAYFASEGAVRAQQSYLRQKFCVPSCAISIRHLNPKKLKSSRDFVVVNLRKYSYVRDESLDNQVPLLRRVSTGQVRHTRGRWWVNRRQDGLAVPTNRSLVAGP